MPILYVVFLVINHLKVKFHPNPFSSVGKQIKKQTYCHIYNISKDFRDNKNKILKNVISWTDNNYNKCVTHKIV